ncbi:hypothetical protein [Nocardioides oleivorans]|uniref:hypothetical protein n=1 Tax=Nocardioides oleivorans TaxID=273676 RepID=UPI0013EA157A|nr:hypothetical protein [Nocardioides oleivorans]
MATTLASGQPSLPSGRAALRAAVPVVATVVALHVGFVLVRAVAVGGLDGFVVYDGRAYFRIALDPLTLAVTDHGITFTRPAYWQTRIGYPLTAWLGSLGGRIGLVAGALVLVNLLAIAGIALAGACTARRLGHSAWWGGVPALWAGFLVGLGQDLTEPLAGVLLLGALVLLRTHRHLLASLALTAAGITRETTLLVAATVLGCSVLAPVLASVLPARGRRTAPGWWVGALPLVTYAAWRTWVHARWSDVVPDPTSGNPVGVPVVELVHYVGTAALHPLREAPNVVLLVPTLLALALAATALRGGGPAHERLALAGYLLVLVSLPVWDRGQAYLRWGCEPLVIGWLLLVGQARTTTLRRLGAAVAVVWVVAATQSVAYPLPGAWWTWS